MSDDSTVDLYRSAELIAALNVFAGGPLAFESILWAIFSCIVIFSAILFMRDISIRNKRKIFMMSICAIMYAMATAHFGLIFDWWRSTTRSTSRELEQSQVQYGNHTTARPLVSPNIVFDDGYYLQMIMVPSCAPSTFLTVDIVIGDAIVLFRACKIWGRSRTIRAISIVLFVALIASSAFNLCTSCLPGLRRGCIFCDAFTGILTVAISCLLNLWATGVIGYKLWTHKRIIGNYLASGNKRTRSEKVLVLFVDSGVLYALLWVVVIIGLAISAPIMGKYLQTTGLIQLVGMYPTILVVAVSWQTLQTNETIRSIHVLTTQARNAQMSVSRDPNPSKRNRQGETDILVRESIEGGDSIAPVIEIELGGVGEAEDLEASLKNYMNSNSDLKS